VTVTTFLSLAEALAWEEALWRQHRADSRGDGRTLFFWSSAPGLAVPRRHATASGFATAAAASAARGWPVAQRGSGGGCVPQGPAVLNVTWLPRPDGIEAIYRRLEQALLRALAACGVEGEIRSPPGAWCRGCHDLCVGGRKVAGLSQRRDATGRTLAHAAVFVGATPTEGLAAARRFLSEAAVDEDVRAAAACGLALPAIAPFAAALSAAIDPQTVPAPALR